MFLNENVQAVIVLICEKHAAALTEKLSHCRDGNWFVLPSTAASQMGYWPHVSSSHSSRGQAVLGFAESAALARVLEQLASVSEDGSVCPDCVAYEWDIQPKCLMTSSVDPVCGKPVNCDNAFPLRRDDRLFFFCSIGCRDKFQSASKDSDPV